MFTKIPISRCCTIQVKAFFLRNSHTITYTVFKVGRDHAFDQAMHVRIHLIPEARVHPPPCTSACCVIKSGPIGFETISPRTRLAAAIFAKGDAFPADREFIPPGASSSARHTAHVCENVEMMRAIS